MLKSYDEIEIYIWDESNPFLDRALKFIFFQLFPDFMESVNDFQKTQIKYDWKTVFSG